MAPLAGATRRPIIGVMGSGTERHGALAAPLGAWIARAGHHLLTGGGPGVMAAVSEAFVAVQPRAGLCIGVVAGVLEEGVPRPPAGYPNRWVELPIQTHLPLRGGRGAEPMSRNHLNVLTASALVVLPGGDGTRTEIELAARYARPAVAYGPADAFEALPPGLRRVASLDEVAAFVQDALRSRAPRQR